jgi:tetratricopeptide (TPR) repeat protein
VDLDPDYALAWAALADCYTLLSWYGLAVPRDLMPKATEAARRAVALDSSLAEAHSVLAITLLMGDWNKAEAEREILRALQLDPKCTPGLGWYAVFFLQLSQGRLMEGMEQAKLVLASDPLSGYAHAMYALSCNIAGEIAESVEVGKRAVQLDPESRGGRVGIGLIRPASLVHGLACRSSRGLGRSQ